MSALEILVSCGDSLTIFPQGTDNVVIFSKLSDIASLIKQ